MTVQDYDVSQSYDSTVVIASLQSLDVLEEVITAIKEAETHREPIWFEDTVDDVMRVIENIREYHISQTPGNSILPTREDAVRVPMFFVMFVLSLFDYLIYFELSVNQESQMRMVEDVYEAYYDVFDLLTGEEHTLSPLY